MLYFSRYSDSLLCINLSGSFLNISRIDMGLYFEHTIAESRLWIEQTIPTFKLYGKTTCRKDIIIIRDSLVLIKSPDILKNVGCMPYNLLAFLVPKFLVPQLPHHLMQFLVLVVCDSLSNLEIGYLFLLDISIDFGKHLYNSY